MLIRSDLTEKKGVKGKVCKGPTCIEKNKEGVWKPLDNFPKEGVKYKTTGEDKYKKNWP